MPTEDAFPQGWLDEHIAKVSEKAQIRQMLMQLAVCDLEHGYKGNSATVFGHYGSPRTCIRVKATDQWVYDPAWEKR